MIVLNVFFFENNDSDQVGSDAYLIRIFSVRDRSLVYFYCCSTKDNLDPDIIKVDEIKKLCLTTQTYVVPSISFQTSFVQAFKIVVNSWKYTVLLLYILWDDWPIFTISSSKEQLQQELEYTLLKPYFHSWCISKMQPGREDTLKERYAIKFCFKLGKIPQKRMECFGMIFGASCINWASVFEWRKRFKKGRESVRDDERCGRSKEVSTQELIGQRLRVRVTMLRF